MLMKDHPHKNFLLANVSFRDAPPNFLVNLHEIYRNRFILSRLKNHSQE